MKDKKIIFLAFFFAILSFFGSIGYAALFSDQRIYLPAIFDQLSSGALNQDFLLSFNQTALTFFDELLVGLVRITHVDFFWVMLFLSLLGRFVFFWAIALLAKKIGLKTWGIILALLVFIFPIEIYGTGMNLMESELHPRFLSLALGLFFLALLLNKKIIASAIVWGVAFLIHPLSSLPFLVFYAWKILVSKDFVFSKKILFWILPLLFFIFPLMNISQIMGNGNPLIIDSKWLEILRNRSYYLFITSWEFEKIAKTLVDGIMLGFLFYLWKKDDRKDIRKDFLALFGIALLFLGLSFLLVDILHIALFTSVQFARFLALWKILLPLMILVRIFSFGKQDGNVVPRQIFLWGFLVSFVLDNLVLGFIFLLLVVGLEFWKKAPLGEKWQKKIMAVFDSSKIFLAKLSSKNQKINLSWMIFIGGLAFVGWLFFIPKEIYPSEFGSKRIEEACSWLKENTSSEDIVLTEPFSNEASLIRIECLRPVYVTEKDGAQVVFNREYALEWRRRKDIANEIKSSSEDILKIAQDEKLGLVMVDNDKKKKKYIENFWKVLGDPDFENEKFLVWKLK